MTLSEEIILGKVPLTNQKVESEFGTTKFGDDDLLETHKNPRTNRPHARLTCKLACVHSDMHF